MYRYTFSRLGITLNDSIKLEHEIENAEASCTTYFNQLTKNHTDTKNVEIQHTHYQDQQNYYRKP